MQDLVVGTINVDFEQVEIRPAEVAQDVGDDDYFVGVRQLGHAPGIVMKFFLQGCRLQAFPLNFRDPTRTGSGQQIANEPRFASGVRMKGVILL